MSADWSPQQRRCLDELGYTLYRQIAPDKPQLKSPDATGTDDRLAKALLRAAGLDPSTAADFASWMLAQGMPLPSQLRGDAAAKRALWPRLRALRRGRMRP